MSMTIYDSVKKSIAFIEANLQNDIGVLDVANSVSYSQFYFSREFSKHTHISIYDYILRRKISEAYQCIFETGPKILDLAFKFGFQSHEVFTRAFRKVFGENPSEVRIYKSLRIYEPIDELYLDFLHELRFEFVDEPDADCYFEVVAASELNAGSSFLALLSDEHLLSCKCMLEGKVKPVRDKSLSYKLCNLKHKIRIYHKDEKLSFRYFINNYYDVNEMDCNFILMKNGKDFIDVMISNKP